MRISESEQHVLDKLETAGIDPFKTGMYFLMKRLQPNQMLVITVVDDNKEIVSIDEATKWDIAEAPENSLNPIVFPGQEYVAMFPRFNLHIKIEKR